MKRLFILLCVLIVSCNSNNRIVKKRLFPLSETIAGSDSVSLLLCVKINNTWKVDLLKTKDINYLERKIEDRASGFNPIFVGGFYRTQDTCLVYCYDENSLDNISELFNTEELSKRKPEIIKKEMCNVVPSLKQYIVSEDGTISRVPIEDVGQLKIYANCSFVLSLFGDRTYEFSYFSNNEKIIGLWKQLGNEIELTPRYHCKYLSLSEEYIIKTIEEYPVILANLLPEKVLMDEKQVILQYDYEEPLLSDESCDLSFVRDSLKLVYATSSNR